jgi:hypothetical protein
MYTTNARTASGPIVARRELDAFAREMQLLFAESAALYLRELVAQPDFCCDLKLFAAFGATVETMLPKIGPHGLAAFRKDAPALCRSSRVRSGGSHPIAA